MKAKILAPARADTVETGHAWPGLHFQKTFSWDAVIILLATVATSVFSVGTFVSHVNDQEIQIHQVQKSVDDVQASLQRQIAETDAIEKERADRLEQAIRDQNLLLQRLMLPQLRR